MGCRFVRRSSEQASGSDRRGPGVAGGHGHSGKLGRAVRGHQRHWPDHALRRDSILDAVCGRSEELRSAAVHREERTEEDGHLHSVRRRSVAVCHGRRAADDYARVRGSRRRVHRVGHRRVHHHRERAHLLSRGWSAQDFPLLHSVVDHQPGCGPGLDSLWRQGPQPGDLHRLHGVGARDRRFLRDHQARRGRRDDFRRRRSGGLPDGRRRVCRATRTVDPQ